MKRFRITLIARGRYALLHVYSGGALAGELLMPWRDATAWLDALRAGHVGSEGSGADVEIVTADEPPPRRT